MHGYANICMDMHVYVWTYMEMHGYGGYTKPPPPALHFLFSRFLHFPLYFFVKSTRRTFLFIFILITGYHRFRRKVIIFYFPIDSLRMSMIPMFTYFYNTVKCSTKPPLSTLFLFPRFTHFSLYFFVKSTRRAFLFILYFYY
jgi:hypothetical protein